MIAVRKSQARGIGRHGWLTTRHTYSFANYYDPVERENALVKAVPRGLTKVR